MKETKSNAQSAKKQNGTGKKQRFDKEKKKESKHTFSHPWLVCSLRGHSAPITGVDFSLNGKYVATCAEGKNLDKITGENNIHKAHRINYFMSGYLHFTVKIKTEVTLCS